MYEGRVVNTTEIADIRESLPQGWRIINAEQHLACIREIILHPRTVSILGRFYRDVPTVLQTLYYEYGSGQMTHSDFPNVDPPCSVGFQHGSLVGSTVYFEEATMSNGALYTFPGSHKY